jgi:hypothetical protein
VMPASGNTQNSSCTNTVNFAGRRRFIMPECPRETCDGASGAQGGRKFLFAPCHGQDVRPLYRPTWTDFETRQPRFCRFTNDTQVLYQRLNLRLGCHGRARRGHAEAS